MPINIPKKNIAHVPGNPNKLSLSGFPLKQGGCKSSAAFVTITHYKLYAYKKLMNSKFFVKKLIFEHFQ